MSKYTSTGNFSQNEARGPSSLDPKTGKIIIKEKEIKGKWKEHFKGLRMADQRNNRNV